MSQLKFPVAPCKQEQHFSPLSSIGVSLLLRMCTSALVVHINIYLQDLIVAVFRLAKRVR